MNQLDATFEELKTLGKKALIGYVTAGFPSKASFQPLVRGLEAAGLSILEIGIPFSDPIADGPTIQKSSQVALENGVTLDWVLQSLRELRNQIKLPLVIMSYSNPIYAKGVDHFFAEAKHCGVDGLIIPDLIPDEAEIFAEAAEKYGVHLIFMVAPTTPPERMRAIADVTGGFLYVVSLTGVTGARSSLPKQLKPFLKRLRRWTKKPIAVGFGISTPAHVRSVRQDVDGVIVGSALIKQIAQSLDLNFRHASRFVRSLQRALNPGKK